MTNKKNTVEIGDNFEYKSLSIIRRVIDDGQLGHLSNHIKIFHRKGYYSELRKKDIVFDLTIEVWPPGATRYVLLYIIECKDYEKRVPVSKIEDFHSKIQQVAGVNVKGIFISNSPLQEGGFNIAESTGMMVIQGESSDDFKIIMHRKAESSEIRKIPFIVGTANKINFDSSTEHLEQMLDRQILNAFQLISDDLRISYNLDYLSKENIESIANTELNKIDPRTLSHGYTFNPEKLIEYISNEYGIQFSYISDSNLLGVCNVSNNSIAINKSLKGTNREFFTMAHEFGHYTLHQKLSIGQTLYNSFEDSEFNFITGKNRLENPRHWIEWQANYFATSLILPKAALLLHLRKFQRLLNMSEGVILLTDQRSSVKEFLDLIDKLVYCFGVSKIINNIPP